MGLTRVARKRFAGSVLFDHAGAREKGNHFEDNLSGVVVTGKPDLTYPSNR